MKRRAFVRLCGIAVAASLTPARAQGPALPVIGVLGSMSADASIKQLAGFRAGLKEAGYIEDRNFTINERWSEGQYDRLPALAAEFVKRKVSAIMAGGLPAALAAKAATSSIPIVFVMGADPVKLGVVSSMSRPGGNVTGVSQLFGELGAKRLELLGELAPKATLIGVLSNRSNPNAEAHLQDIQAAAKLVRKKIHVRSAGSGSDIEAAFANFVQVRAGALLVADDPLFTTQRRRIVELAARNRIPTIHYARDFTEAGGLLSYGSNGADNYRLAGGYIGRILGGAKPTDLPVVQPTKFELVINLKAAKEIGLTIPRALLVRADEVIQ
jgi:putative ABC transport system substrate-binding protein